MMQIGVKQFLLILQCCICVFVSVGCGLKIKFYYYYYISIIIMITQETFKVPRSSGNPSGTSKQNHLAKSNSV